MRAAARQYSYVLGLQRARSDLMRLAGEFRSVAAGQSHVCAIRSEGGLTCWGRNWYGETEAPDGSFLAVSAGTDHNCGLRANGSVFCWGRDHDRCDRRARRALHHNLLRRRPCLRTAGRRDHSLLG